MCLRLWASVRRVWVFVAAGLCVAASSVADARVMNMVEISDARTVMNTFRSSGTDGAGDGPLFARSLSDVIGSVGLELAPDGAAIACVGLGRADAANCVSLSGTWRDRDGRIAVNLSMNNRLAAMSLDGVLTDAGDERLFSGVWSIAVPQFRRVETLTARFAPENGERSLKRPPVAAKGPRTKRLADDEFYDGVPLGAKYDVDLDVSLDGKPAGGRRATLLVSPGGTEGGGNPVDIHLLSSGESGEAGWSAWSSGDDGGRDAAVSVAGGRILVGLAPRSPVNSVGSWRVPVADDSRAVSAIHTTGGLIEVNVTPDEAWGTVSAVGVDMNDDGVKRVERRFEARFRGTRAGRAALNAARAVLGDGAFDGTWLPIGGRGPGLWLRRDGDILGGVSRDGRDIEGTIDGRSVDARWSSANGTGGALFTVSAAGMLTGTLWPDGGGIFEHVVAEHPREVTPPTNDDEASSLRWFGDDLAQVGKHMEAVTVLREVSRYYGEKKAAGPHWWDDVYNVRNDAISVHTLIDSAALVGEYDALLDGLSRALDIVWDNDVISRLERAVRKMWEERLSTLSKADRDLVKWDRVLGSAFDFVVRGGIGVNSKTVAAGVEITEVNVDSPAERAGLRAGDVIVSIDEKSTAGLSEDEITGALRGTPGSWVSLGILREGNTISRRLSRDHLLRIAPETRETLRSNLAGLREVIARLRGTIKAEADGLRGKSLAKRPDRATMNAAIDDLAIGLGTSVRVTGEALGDVERSARAAIGIDPIFGPLFDEALALGAGAGEGEEGERRLRDADERERAAISGGKSPKWLSTLYDALGRLHVDVKVFGMNSRNEVRMFAEVAGSAVSSSAPEENAEVMRMLALRLETWRKALADDPARILAVDQSASFHDKLIRLLADLGLPEQALVASEAARARAFTDLLARSAGTGGTARPSEFQLPTPSDIRAVVTDVRATFVEYHLLDDELFIWTLRPGVDADTPPTIRLERKKIAKSVLREKAARLSASLDAEDGREVFGNEAAIERELEELRGILIPMEIERELPADPESPVVIVPHDALFKVPFAALARRDDGRETRYLVDDHAVTTAFSLDSLRVRSGVSDSVVKPRESEVLAVIPSGYERGVVDARGEPFAKVEWNEAGIDALRRMFAHWSEARGAEARVEPIRERMPKADVVLFFTHGEAFADRPRESRIALGDGYLRVSDIDDGPRLRARLVVLAACQTALGRVSAEGVDGMTRMLLGSGAKSLLSSLWSVPGKTSLIFVYEFINNWASKGYSMSSALRHAQLRFKYLNPRQVSHWAGFAMNGDPR